MTDVDYSAPADLFPCGSKRGNRPVGYRRFDTAAETIRYAIEVMPADFLPGTAIEPDDERLDGPRIRKLYDSSAYPRSCESLINPFRYPANLWRTSFLAISVSSNQVFGLPC